VVEDGVEVVDQVILFYAITIAGCSGNCSGCISSGGGLCDNKKCMLGYGLNNATKLCESKFKFKFKQSLSLAQRLLHKLKVESMKAKRLRQTLEETIETNSTLEELIETNSPSLYSISPTHLIMNDTPPALSIWLRQCMLLAYQPSPKWILSALS